MAEFILERGNYWAIVGLMMIGLYIAFSPTNLIKRLIGLGMFQTSIILFYITLARIDGGTAPILYGVDDPKAQGGHGGHEDAGHGETTHGETGSGEAGLDALAGHDASAGQPVDAQDVPEALQHIAESAHDTAAAAHGAGFEHVYSNPLPHVLMLTAIVVGVATLAVGLGIIARIREAYGTIEMDEIRAMDIELALSEVSEQPGEQTVEKGAGV